MTKQQKRVGEDTPLYDRDSIEFYNDKRRWNDEARKLFIFALVWREDTPNTYFYGLFGIYQASYLLNQMVKDGFIEEVRIGGTRHIRARQSLFTRDLFSSMG